MSTVMPQDILFRGGGATLRRLQALHSAGSGRVEVAHTFSRADAAPCATFHDADLVPRIASANLLRLDWPSGLVDASGNPIPGILLEGSRTNAFTKSEKFDDAAWTKTRSSISANATTAPDGTVTADKLIEDATASATHIVNRNTPALTDATLQPFYVYAKAAERTWLQLLPTNKAGNVIGAYFNLAAGTIGTVDSGVTARIRAAAQGFYRCAISFPSSSGATTPLVRIGLATGDGGGTYSGNGTSGAYIWRAGFETDKIFDSSAISTDAAAVTRAADSLTCPFNFGPQSDLTILVRMARPPYADISGTLAASPRIFELGTAANAVIGYFDSVSRVVGGQIDTTSTDQFQTAAIPAGAALNVVWQFKNLTTGGQVAVDVGSGLTAFSSAATAFSSYGNQTLRLGGSAGSELFSALGEIIVARGLFTRSEMLAIP